MDNRIYIFPKGIRPKVNAIETVWNTKQKNVTFLIVMVPTLQTIMNSSNYYKYWENIYLGVELTPAVLDCV